jgi:hypothetical protein
MFWNKLSRDLGCQLEKLLGYEGGKLTSDVAALYLAVRTAALNLLGSLYDTMHANSTGAWDDSNTGSVGILGGLAVLNHTLWTESQDSSSAALGMASADTWTRTDTATESEGRQERFSSTSGTTSSMSAIFHSDEWKVLQRSGLFALQQAFLEATSSRLCEPQQYMF